MVHIRNSRGADLPAMLPIVNAAAQAYRGVIPADRWHEPYMPAAELDAEIAGAKSRWCATPTFRRARQIETSVVLADGRWTQARRQTPSDI
jgi:hypothetical protein